MAKTKSKKRSKRSEENEKLAEEGKFFINERINKLSNLTEEAVASKEFKSWLRVYSKFHNYSIGNVLWLVSQAYTRGVDPERFASFTTWKSISRNVRKGEKSFKVLAPVPVKYKDSKDLNTNGEAKLKQFMRFRVASTFELSQTEGEDIPSIDYRTEGEDFGLIDKLEAFAKSKNIDFAYVDEKELGSAKGCSRGGSIQVLDSLTGASRAATFAHELGHELLHWANGAVPSDHERSTLEIEAEATSFIVLEHFGIDASKSSFYLAAWKGSAVSIKQSLSSIRRSSKEILDFILDS